MVRSPRVDSQIACRMTRSVHTHAVRILLSLYFVETAVLLALVGIYKAPSVDWTLLSTKAGAVLTAGGVGLIASGWFLVREIEASGSLRVPLLRLVS